MCSFALPSHQVAGLTLRIGRVNGTRARLRRCLAGSFRCQKFGCRFCATAGDTAQLCPIERQDPSVPRCQSIGCGEHGESASSSSEPFAAHLPLRPRKMVRAFPSRAAPKPCPNRTRATFSTAVRRAPTRLRDAASIALQAPCPSSSADRSQAERDPIAIGRLQILHLGIQIALPPSRTGSPCRSATQRRSLHRPLSRADRAACPVPAHCSSIGCFGTGWLVFPSRSTIR
jgi:hypothetical protein